LTGRAFCWQKKRRRWSNNKALAESKFLENNLNNCLKFMSAMPEKSYQNLQLFPILRRLVEK